MKKKSVLAVMMALAMMASVGAPAITSQAAGLTQAQDATKVQYGSLTADDTQLLQSLFDYEYYKSQNADLVSVLGDDPAKLFEHFCKCGIFEGRTCNANFDPAAYASAYTDLRDSFGTNIIKYYEHFAKFAAAENRTISTVAACAKAGITVQGLVGDDVKISPAAYMLAEKLGTTDYAAVQQAVAQATNAENEAKASTNSGSIIITKEPIDPVFAKANGLESVGTVQMEKDVDSNGKTHGHTEVHIYVAKGNVGYGAYKGKDSIGYFAGSEDDVVLIKATEGYEKANDFVNSLIGGIDVYMVTNDYSKTSEGTATANYDGAEHQMKVVFEKSGNIPDEGTRMYSVGRYEPDVKNKGDEATKMCSVTDTQTVYEKDSNELIDPSTKNDYSGPSLGSWTYDVAVDEKATLDTVYNLGVSLEQEGEKVNLSVGLSNEDDNYGYITTYEFDGTSND